MSQTEELLTRSPDGHEYVQWLDQEGLHRARPSTGLLRESFEENSAIRIGSQYKNRPNQHGLHYWMPTRRHLWFESGLERNCLIELEFSGRIQRIATQPFRLLFGAGAKGRSHDPDFFGVLLDGTQVVFDVKPIERMTDRDRDQFTETARVCESIGWSHEILHEPDPTVLLNLQNLRPDRLARAHPEGEKFDQLIQIFEGGRSVAEGRLVLNRRFPALAMPLIKHLIWHGYLTTDMRQRLDFDSVLVSSTKGATCCPTT